MLLVSPTEPAAIRKLGKVAVLPEEKGVDVLIPTRRGYAGIQRKELRDLIASVRDGRLQKEMRQMRALNTALLIVERYPTWTTEGALVDSQWSKWTQQQHWGLLWSLQAANVWVMATCTFAETVDVVRAFAVWAQKDEHGSLRQRPGPRGKWGKATNREWVEWLLQGIPGIGAGLSEKIVDRYGCPLRWTVGKEELMEVEGIGETKAGQMIDALEAGT